MASTTDDLKRVSAPSPFRGPIVIKHEGWLAARDAVLRACSRPRTITIVGPPGSGKSWLLREISQELTRRGTPTTLLLQGDLPFAVTEGAALLIDEADRMAAPLREELQSQRDGLVVLAALEHTGGMRVELSPLDRAATRQFVASWLQQVGEPQASLDKAAIEALSRHSNGTPRLLVQLLTAALAMSEAPRTVPISAADIDGVAAMRLGGTELRPPPPAPTRAWATWWPGIIGGAAVAAGLMVAWVATERRARPPLPAIQPAILAAPQQASVPPPPAALAPDRAVMMATIPTAEPATVPEALPSLAAAEPPLRPAPARRGGAGFVIVAQRGDTLQGLYASIYRGMTPPAYQDVLAANPRPFEPGAVVVFPEPPDGWQLR